MHIEATVIAGPTASGKTKAAIELALKRGGEIVSCDSAAIYIGMDIGTAKPDKEEQSLVKHHMIDIVRPCDEYSVAEFTKEAKACIRDIAERNKYPILCGGTGLYISSMVENISFPEEIKDDSITSSLYEYYNQCGASALHELLEKDDKAAAEEIHPNNVKRVVRAIELYRITGKTRKQRIIESKAQKGDIEYKVYAIDCERQQLYERIDRRVDRMIEQGLEAETKEILSRCKNEYGKDISSTASQAIGYKQFIEYLSGAYDLETCVDKIKQYTRNYAKRQLTWFRKPEWVHWVRADEIRM